jgi:hypothetical protein
MMCDNISTSIDHIRAGRLRALAVTTATRSELLPELPTVSDFLPGFEQSAIFGVGAPRDTSKAIIERLNTEINAGLADPKLRERFADLAGPVLPGSPGDFGRLIAECPSEDFLSPLNHLDSMEPILIRGRGFHCGRTRTGRSTTAIT